VECEKFDYLLTLANILHADNASNGMQTSALAFAGDVRAGSNLCDIDSPRLLFFSTERAQMSPARVEFAQRIH
jgi:hypothetical protein